MRVPQVMRGYLTNPEATAATIDDDGRLQTGDIATVDERGCFTIVDRARELIRYTGFQVAPAELEAVLLTHDAVAAAAVIGTPDPAAGEVPTAFVVAWGEVAAEQLMAFVAERVAPHQRVRVVEFVDQIPTSPSGRILPCQLIDKDRVRPTGPSVTCARAARAAMSSRGLRASSRPLSSSAMIRRDPHTPTSTGWGGCMAIRSGDG